MKSQRKERRRPAALAATAEAWLPSRSHRLLLVAILAAYVLASGLVLWGFTPVDDAFIAYRYARHLAENEGLVFNPGERVEGYSSLSWVLILAAGEAVGLDPAALSKGLGMALGAATLLLLSASWAAPRARLLSAGLLAFWLPAVYHFLNGLETALAAFLVTVLVTVSADTRRARLVRHAAGGLLVLTRPEGLLVVLLWAAVSWLTDRRRQPWQEGAVVLTAAGAFVAQLVFRRLYYGEWIANSARAKLLPLAMALPEGIADLGRFAFQGSAYGVLALLVLAGVLRSRKDHGPPGRELRKTAGFLLLAALTLAASGGDSFPLWRFYVPLAPAFFLCAAQGLELLLGPRARAHHRLRSVALPATVLLAALSIPYPFFLRQIELEASWRDLWTDLGRSLAAIVPPDTSIALCPVGALPFFSRLPTIDMLGLTDRRIARVAPDRRYYYPGHHRHDGRYVLSRQPDLILLANGPVVSSPDYSFPWQGLRPYERDVALDPRFLADYQLIHVPLGSGRYAKLFARRSFLAAAGTLPGIS